MRAADTATADDTAQFLAGLPPADEFAIGGANRRRSLGTPRELLRCNFRAGGRHELSRIRAFAQEHLTDKQDTMLYMFSGPDFLYATSFFPNASTYVLAGLEPVGESRN